MKISRFLIALMVAISVSAAFDGISLDYAGIDLNDLHGYVLSDVVEDTDGDSEDETTGFRLDGFQSSFFQAIPFHFSLYFKSKLVALFPIRAPPSFR